MDRDLEAVLAEAFALLAEGAEDPGSAWRNMTLATVDAALAPQARTVVLRGLDRAARVLEVHTDRRSAKFDQVQRHPRVALHGWDAARAVQLRANGIAVLHVADETSRAAWARLRPQSRATYAVDPGPGHPLARPGEAGTGADAEAVFCVMHIRLDALEFLHLGQGSHRRARFIWSGGVCSPMWLVP